MDKASDARGGHLAATVTTVLQRYASARGIRRFIAEILGRNPRMVRLAKGARGSIRTASDEGEVHATILFTDGAAG